MILLHIYEHAAAKQISRAAGVDTCTCEKNRVFIYLGLGRMFLLVRLLIRLLVHRTGTGVRAEALAQLRFATVALTEAVTNRHFRACTCEQQKELQSQTHICTRSK